ncbi:DNA polymerase III subunit delta' [Parahaliea aestuarii]|uniref:DNA-directed DNA polymerase n=1 Tax=Parahaliea aestuarii TaxID=1852021 RepID=A0A5C8ZRW6_9GAMM|nr:DNA polymerase III subunit delta' [Parahaliea aestuarii]TXS91125.1 DNA polymerase III subunit delta' [Parahaliea aestuarii]
MNLEGLPAVSAPLPWHAEAWQRLGLQLEEGRFPHALLLAGSSGTGKARLALALARLLLCHAPSAGHNCGQCQGCELSRNGTHGDFLWLQPGEKSRVVKIDQVRQAVDFAHWTAGFGQRKVLVISPANAMNTNAANALLKSLEEPSANTHILLVCERLHGVPATIRSRCQILRFPLPAAEPALAWLDSLTGERRVSSELLELAGGAPLRAEDYFRDSSADARLAQEAALTAVLEGRATPVEAAGSLAELANEYFLELLTDVVEKRIRQLGKGQLADQGRAGFGLLDDLRRIQRAMEGGSNPNAALLRESLLEQLRQQLGAPAAGAKMPA